MPTFKIESKDCVKCGYVRKAGDGGAAYACPKCGGVYHKVESAKRVRDNGAPMHGRQAVGTTGVGFFLLVARTFRDRVLPFWRGKQG